MGRDTGHNDLNILRPTSALLTKDESGTIESVKRIRKQLLLSGKSGKGLRKGQKGRHAFPCDFLPDNNRKIPTNAVHKEMTQSSSMMYKIIPIPNYEDLEIYNSFTSWCVLVDPEILKMYLEGNKRFYVAVRKGMYEESFMQGIDYPYDDYGLSLLGIIVKPDGTIDNVTTRWNSIMEDERYYTRQALTELLGQTLPF